MGRAMERVASDAPCPSNLLYFIAVLPALVLLVLLVLVVVVSIIAPVVVAVGGVVVQMNHIVFVVLLADIIIMIDLTIIANIRGAGRRQYDGAPFVHLLRLLRLRLAGNWRRQRAAAIVSLAIKWAPQRKWPLIYFGDTTTAAAAVSTSARFVRQGRRQGSLRIERLAGRRAGGGCGPERARGRTTIHFHLEQVWRADGDGASRH